MSDTSSTASSSDDDKKKKGRKKGKDIKSKKSKKWNQGHVKEVKYTVLSPLSTHCAFDLVLFRSAVQMFLPWLVILKRCDILCCNFAPCKANFVLHKIVSQFCRH